MVSSIGSSVPEEEAAAAEWILRIQDYVLRQTDQPFYVTLPDMYGVPNSVMLPDFNVDCKPGCEEEAMRWLQQILECAKQQEWTAEDCLYGCRTRMKGPAHIWFRKFEALNSIVYHPEFFEDNWIRFLVQFAIAFVVTDREEMLTQVMERKQQLYETVKDYAVALQRLALRIPAAATDAVLRDVFVKGLREHWARTFQNIHSPNSFNAALKLALDHERVKRRSEMRKRLMSRRQQPKEDIMQYAIAITELAAKMSPRLYEDDLIGIFLDGLSMPDIGESVMLRLPRTLNEVVDYAIQCDKQYRSRSEVSLRRKRIPLESLKGVNGSDEPSSQSDIKHQPTCAKIA